jgi:hypothetical protein
MGTTYHGQGTPILEIADMLRISESTDSSMQDMPVALGSKWFPNDDTSVLFLFIQESVTNTSVL